tara:strand:+ start:277 stop:606 length:330 start_codon:yes stop_codon:yes gene_type:complete
LLNNYVNILQTNESSVTRERFAFWFNENSKIVEMNPQILFNASLALVTTGLVLLFKGIFVLGFASLIIAIGTSVVWLMSGFFEKFEYKSPEDLKEDEKDEDGKGVLKPF